MNLMNCFVMADSGVTKTILALNGILPPDHSTPSMPAEQDMGNVVPISLAAAMANIADEVDAAFDRLLPLPEDGRRTLYEVARGQRLSTTRS